MAGSDSHFTVSYPTEEQYQRWKDRADELGMSVSEFIQAMVEAGIKVDRGFELTTERDETNRELREQRNDLKDELARARRRIETLEERLHGSERETVIQHVHDNPGASVEEIVQRVEDSTWERVNDHLEALEGEVVRTDDGRTYYPADDARGES